MPSNAVELIDEILVLLLLLLYLVLLLSVHELLFGLNELILTSRAI